MAFKPQRVCNYYFITQRVCNYYFTTQRVWRITWNDIFLRFRSSKQTHRVSGAIFHSKAVISSAGVWKKSFSESEKLFPPYKRIFNSGIGVNQTDQSEVLLVFSGLNFDRAIKFWKIWNFLSKFFYFDGYH